MRVLRSIGAVIVGYVMFGVAAEMLFYLSGHDPHESASPLFMAITTVYGFCFAVLAGYVAASIAGRRRLFHGAVLACLMAFVAMLSLLVDLGNGSVWSQLATLLFMTPAVMIGAMARLRNRQEKETL